MTPQILKTLATPVTPSPLAGLVSFDAVKFAADPRLAQAVPLIVEDARDACTLPLGLQGIVFNYLEQTILALLKMQVPAPVPPAPVPTGPVVGANAVDAQNYLTSLSASQGMQFTQDVKDKLAAHPEIIDLLKNKRWLVPYHGSHEQQEAKIIASSWLDTIIAWLQSPVFAAIIQILMTLIPLIL